VHGDVCIIAQWGLSVPRFASGFYAIVVDNKEMLLVSNG